MNSKTHKKQVSKNHNKEMIHKKDYFAKLIA